MSLLLLILSYISDWIILAIFAAVGYVIGNITPNKRPFNLGNPDINFPYKGYDTVTIAVAFVVSVVAPAVIIAIVILLLVPILGTPGNTRAPKYNIWRRILWEWHAGWLGLGLSVVLAFFFTSGMKNLFGKPRPNLLSRCQPDVSKVAEYAVGFTISATGRLVSASICTNTDTSVIDDGFRSFPSGHSSAAASGLVYLSLWLAAKLRVGVPFLLGGAIDEAENSIKSHSHHARAAANVDVIADAPGDGAYNTAGLLTYSARRQDAAAPIYLLVIVLIPLGTAIFICASRWYDFQHHGFDIIVGFLMGVLSSILAFKYYHLPMSRGAGFAWAPRSEKKAFWSGLGKGGFSDRRRFYRLSETDDGSHHATENQSGDYESHQMHPV
jgi:membrane-associated phospholipid phosphatase